MGTCNVGALSPNSYGDYFAWGESKTKDTFNWETHSLVSGNDYNNVSWSKYNSVEGRGTVDNKTCLEMIDDAARMNWGGKWRMPTIEEWKELSKKCTWTWTTLEGQNGFRVTASNGNSIFLPASGKMEQSSIEDENSTGFYWSSNYDVNKRLSVYTASSVVFGASFHHIHYHPRCWGLSIRPVTE